MPYSPVCESCFISILICHFRAIGIPDIYVNVFLIYFVPPGTSTLSKLYVYADYNGFEGAEAPQQAKIQIAIIISII